jgi:2-amino-4-hydroxy-6-hydroxymethyldihydropteridine diphosphokinase
MLDAVIGLGANVGDPVESLKGAVRSLQQATELVAISPLFRSTPIGGPVQPDYYNAAARVLFEGGPPELLALLLEIERAHGRQRSERWGPRTLDLDVLWIAGIRIVSTELTVPHARLRERAFALAPLVALVPSAEDPSTGERYDDVLRRVGFSGVEPVARPDWESLCASISRPVSSENPHEFR